MIGGAAGEDEQLMQLQLVLSIIGKELKELSKNIDQIQVALSPVLRRIDLDAKSHRDIQSLDIVSQKLMSLSYYALEINNALPKDLTVDTKMALSFVSVAALKESLKGRNEKVLDEHFSGDLEIF